MRVRVNVACIDAGYPTEDQVRSLAWAPGVLDAAG